MTLSNYIEDLALNHIVTNSTTPFVTTTTIFCSLHTGDPGETGTANPLASCPRFAVVFGAAASATCANNATASVVSSATGTVTFAGLWDGSDTALANHIWSGALGTSKTIANALDTVTLAVGDLRVSLN